MTTIFVPFCRVVTCCLLLVCMSLLFLKKLFLFHLLRELQIYGLLFHDSHLLIYIYFVTITYKTLLYV